jgi:AcrR family transcriptional regulator
MENFVNKIVIKINENVYIKSPQSSKLGEKILKGSINLIDNIGFEEFTFKKLAKKIGSTEASIYRYFDCKHNLLIYLVLWYWGWQEYRLVMKLTNIDNPKERLTRAIKILTEKIEEDSTFSEIDEYKLNRIVIAESSKVYFNKAVDMDNKLGFFNQYKEIVKRVSDIVLEINPEFQYAQMLISTIIEGSHHQRFFAEHLPRLTNVIEGEDIVTKFYTELVFKEIDAKVSL